MMFDVISEANTPLLTAAEERDLARRCASGDAQAREKMILANLKLVQSIATSFLKRHQRSVLISDEDLFSVGVLGLIHALDKFDYKMGYKFSTYATWWIIQAMERQYNEFGYGAPIPVYQIKAIGKLRQARAELLAEGLEPTPAILHARMLQLGAETGKTKLTLEVVHLLLQWLYPVEYLSRPVSGPSGDTLELGETLAAAEDDTYTDLDEQMLIDDLLGQLSPRERTIVEMRYGLGDEQEQPLKQVGSSLHVSGELVRLIEIEALKRMRKAAV